MRVSASWKKRSSSMPERSRAPCLRNGSMPGRKAVTSGAASRIARERGEALQRCRLRRAEARPARQPSRLSPTIFLNRSRKSGGSRRPANSSTSAASPGIGSATTICVRWMRGRSDAARQSLSTPAAPAATAPTPRSVRSAGRCPRHRGCVRRSASVPLGAGRRDRGNPPVGTAPSPRSLGARLLRRPCLLVDRSRRSKL